MQAGGSWAGGAAGSGPVPDSTSRAMQRLKDMYARNVSVHQHSQAPEPQGVKQLLQVWNKRFCSIGKGFVNVLSHLNAGSHRRSTMQWQLLHTALASVQSRASRLLGHVLLATLCWPCFAGHALLACIACMTWYGCTWRSQQSCVRSFSHCSTSRKLILLATKCLIICLLTEHACTHA